MTNVILQGIVGSTAQGLARDDSDVDHAGVFVAPTTEVAGLWWNQRKESIVSHEPEDLMLHEVAKFLRLGLTCNPTIMELLSLPPTLYETRSTLGSELIELVPAFLSEDAVRKAYGLYAKGQASDLLRTKGVAAKQGRHMLRLLRQGRRLLATGELVVKVDNPEEYWAFDELEVTAMLEIFDKEYALFEAAPSILPEEPNEEAVAKFLALVRRRYV